MSNKSFLVDVFRFPYEEWSYRDKTIEEMQESGPFFEMIKDHLIDTVTNHEEAAYYALKNSHNNQFQQHIDSMLNESSEYTSLRHLMPKNDPSALVSYQNRCTEEDKVFADRAIKEYGTKLASGQILYHGGYWKDSTCLEITTTRPFSTSFCPQIAVRNAEWNGKAYNNGAIHLFILKVLKPKSLAYIFSRRGEKGCEKEVVFESGTKIVLIRAAYFHKIKVSAYDYLLGKVVSKDVPATILYALII